MKTFFILVLIITSAKTFAQEEIQWLSWEEAISMQDKQPKKLFIDVYTDWCGWCKKMDNSTFTYQPLVAYLNENYYPIKFDAEQNDTIVFNGKTYINPNPEAPRSSHQMAQALLQGNMSYPSYAFLNEEVKMLQILKGYQTQDYLLTVLKFFAEDIYLEMSFQDYYDQIKDE